MNEWITRRVRGISWCWLLMPLSSMLVWFLFVRNSYAGVVRSYRSICIAVPLLIVEELGLIATAAVWERLLVKLLSTHASLDSLGVLETQKQQSNCDSMSAITKAVWTKTLLTPRQTRELKWSLESFQTIAVEPFQWPLGDMMKRQIFFNNYCCFIIRKSNLFPSNVEYLCYCNCCLRFQWSTRWEDARSRMPLVYSKWSGWLVRIALESLSRDTNEP